MPLYYDNWKNSAFACEHCEWHGTGNDLEQGEVYSTYCELLCPACHQYITVMMFPSLEESRVNWEKLSDAERKQVEDIEQFQANFQVRKLRDTTPLPAISSTEIVLYWDFQVNGKDRETVIRHGDAAIFSEPAIYEGATRYLEVADILIKRFGNALQDLIPTRQSELYLYGDQMHAPKMIEEYRQKHFTGYKKIA